MKGMGAALGVAVVVVVGAGAYFLAKGKRPPTNTGKAPVPAAGAKAQVANLAMNQLTSANLASLGTFGKTLFSGAGGAAKVAPTENGGFVTTVDYQPRTTPGTGDYASDFVTELE